ncbi:MAG: Mur ligase family protein [Chloroflexota bacterium]|nr:Mur ligase family protein [Chloroflexota bacterium]
MTARLVELRRPTLGFRESPDGLRASVAFTWRRRTIGQAIGAAAAHIALGERAFGDAVRQLAAVAPGPVAAVPRPRIPVVAITGTNGKTTVTRLVIHIAQSAGLRVGATTSDGIVIRGDVVERGDWTGYGGAGRVLAEPQLDLAVLETARGGILLRGIGYTRNDVSVVTNISADHLGLQGIDTLDELADVKASLVRLTRRDGWAVLNADDARVWEMRREARARVYAFSLDQASPHADATLERGGRAAVLDDEWLVLRAPGRAPHRLARAADVPITLAGAASHNVANALAAAAAADAVGIDRDAIAVALRAFTPDADHNPGRLNLYRLDGRTVVIDFAHNEAGLRTLIDVCRRLSGGGRVCLGLGTAGDRSDEILVEMGATAARGAHRVVIAEKPHYLRGRDRDSMKRLFRAGAADAGMEAAEIADYPSELDALRALVADARPGDVVALMCHAEREEVAAWLSSSGATRIDAREVLAGR